MRGERTPKQEKFCQKYVELGCGASAYRAAYDAENMKPVTVRRKAAELLENGNVAARVRELQASLLKRHEVTVDRVLQEFAKLAFLDIRKAFDENGNLKPVIELDDDTAAAIAALDVETLFDGKGSEREAIGRLSKIKLIDKKGALDSLARHLGMFNDSLEMKGKLTLTHEDALNQLAGQDDPA